MIYDQNSEEKDPIYKSEEREAKAGGCCYVVDKKGLVIYWN
jgi:hypothetical protein